MKQILTALTIAATMFASSASAYDPDDLQKLSSQLAWMAQRLAGV